MFFILSFVIEALNQFNIYSPFYFIINQFVYKLGGFNFQNILIFFFYQQIMIQNLCVFYILYIVQLKMAENLFGLSSCSNCSKQSKYDPLVSKCLRHSFKLCVSCNRQLRGKQCPQCQKQKNVENISSPSDRGVVKKNADTEYSQSSTGKSDNFAHRIDVVEMINGLNIEQNQKYKLIKEWELEVERIKSETQKTLNNHHLNNIRDKQQAYKQLQQNYRQLRISKERQSVQFHKMLDVEKENQRQFYEKERQNLTSQHMMEIDILNTQLVNQKQKLKIAMEGEKKQTVERYRQYQAQIKKSFEQRQELLKLQYQAIINKIKNQKQFQIQTITNQKQFQKKQLMNKLTLQMSDMKRKYQTEKDALIYNQEFQKKIYLEKIEEIKKQMGQNIEEKTQLQHKLTMMMKQQKEGFQQKLTAKEQIASIAKTNYEALIFEQNQKIQYLSKENQKLITHIGNYNNSVQNYEKQSEQLNAYIQNTSKLLVEQFRSLDQTYAPGSNQKLRMTNILVKQYKQLTKKTANPQLKKLVRERQIVLNNFVISEMTNFQSNIKQLKVADFYYKKDEKGGNKLRMMVQKINIIRSLDIPNVMDSVETLYHRKLVTKIKETIQKLNKSLFAATKDQQQFQAIKYIDEYYRFKQYLGKQFTQFVEECENLFVKTEEEIKEQFDNLEKRMELIAQVEESEQLQNIANKSQQLKKFILIMNFSKSYPYYIKQLEKYHKITYDFIKTLLVKSLKKNKIILKNKLQQFIRDRRYDDCYKNQIIFKKLKVFDELFTKEENHYYNFNFTQLHNKIQHTLANLKEQKLHLVDITVTQNHINTQQLKKEYRQIIFDQNIRKRYDNTLQMALERRNIIIQRINQYYFSNGVNLQDFKMYYLQLLDIKTVNQFDKMACVGRQEELFNRKISYLRFYLRDQFNQCLINTVQYKHLSETYHKINYCIETEVFMKQYFRAQYQTFKLKAMQKFKKLFQIYPQFNNETDNFFREVLALNKQNQQSIQIIVRDPQFSFNPQIFKYYNNIIMDLRKDDINIMQEKLDMFIDAYIRHNLEQKAWNESDNSSQQEKKLANIINRLSEKEVSYYREVVSKRKNQFFEDRQRIIKDEKRKLKQQNFQSLYQFVQDCHKCEEKRVKNYKTYISILQDYLNYYYQKYHNNHEKMCAFLQNMYKCSIHQYGKVIPQLFKTIQYKTYFNNPQISSLRKSIDKVQMFTGQDYAKITKSVSPLNEILIKYTLYKRYQKLSLLQQFEKNEFDRQIQQLNNLITANYKETCVRIQTRQLFDLDCNRKQYFLELIKIQIYSKLMKIMRNIGKQEQNNRELQQYKVILQKINNRISKIYEEINQFKFYKTQLNLHYDDSQYLTKYLRNVQNHVNIFKEIEYIKDRYKDYSNNNYFEGLHLHKIKHHQLVNIVSMTWRKEYTIIKKELKELIHQPTSIEVMKYKLILRQKQIINHENMLCFQEALREQYDFKKMIERELIQINSKIQSNLLQLQKETQSSNDILLAKQQKKKHKVEQQIYRIRMQYEKLKDQVKNSFHQIDNVDKRANKIEGQINSLNNQMKAEEDNIKTLQINKIQRYREKFNLQRNVFFERIIGLLRTVIKIQNNFDNQIENRSKDIFINFERQLKKADRQTFNKAIQYIKGSNNIQILERMSGMSIIKNSNKDSFIKNLQNMNHIDQIINKCQQISPSLAQKIKNSYHQYQAEFKKIEKQYFQHQSQNIIQNYIKNTKQNALTLSPAVLIARIFAVYAIYKSREDQSNEINIAYKLHSVQIVAALLLIGAGSKQMASLANRLVQVKPGEGKSRVLGGVCCYLALRGFEVYCGCYSCDLAQRDQKQFKQLFATFGIQDKIQYGSLAQHCETVLNEGYQYNFNQIMKKVILKENLSQNQQQYLQRIKNLFKRKTQRKKILVVDQLDTIFDQSFFGQIYSPCITLDSNEVKQFLKFVWKNKDDENCMNLVQQSQQYKQLKSKYPPISELIENQISQIVHASMNFNMTRSQIKNNGVSQIKNNFNSKYDKIFASCFQYQKEMISEVNYNKNLSINLILGQLSYAQLPNCFDFIMGVSGTAQVISPYQKSIIKNNYQIKEVYILPSIYKKSLIQTIGLNVCSQAQYYKTLAKNISEVRRSQRPVIIFFQNQEQLNKAIKSEQLSKLVNQFYKITEKVPQGMRNSLLNYAGHKNRITFISAQFSKGVDFKVYSDELNEKGGMHVIQTFISRNQSDYLQLINRTGRQGKKGTFEIVVKKNLLQNHKIKIKQLKPKQLQEIWQYFSKKQEEKLAQTYQKAREKHQKTFNSIKSVSDTNNSLTDLFIKLNYISDEKKSIHTIIAIDSTTSMGPWLAPLIKILKSAFKRIQNVFLQKHPKRSYMHKIMLYRNYNSPFNSIIEASEFSKDSAYLQSFISKTQAKGGVGRKAFEVLFYDVGKMIENKENVNQIIIIGDSPANKIEEISKQMQKYGGKAKWSQKMPLYETTQQYRRVIMQHKIPIHSLYILKSKNDDKNNQLNRAVQQSFKRLSAESNGISQQLKIHEQSKYQDEMINLIVERVLQLMGGPQLVQHYKNQIYV